MQIFQQQANTFFWFGDSTIKDGCDANFNNGFTIRSALVLAGRILNSIIPLNKFSFFKGIRKKPSSADSNSDKPQVNR